MSPTVDDGVGPGSRQVTELTRQSYPMRKLAISLFILDVALSFLSSCSSSSKAEPQLSGPIGIVRFPDPWVKVIDDTTRGVNDNIGYVIRKSGRGELLFAIKQRFAGELYGKEVLDFPVESPDYDYYRDNRFAVTLDGAFRVREATIAEWDAAEKPVHSYHFVTM